MESVDKTLFLLRCGKDMLVIQICMDDIIFGGTSHDLVARFADDMSREFDDRRVELLPRASNQATQG